MGLSIELYALVISSSLNLSAIYRKFWRIWMDLLDPDSLELNLSSDIDDPDPIPRVVPLKFRLVEGHWEKVLAGPDDEERIVPELLESDDEDEDEDTGEEPGWEDLAEPTVGDILGENYDSLFMHILFIKTNASK